MKGRFVIALIIIIALHVLFDFFSIKKVFAASTPEQCRSQAQSLLTNILLDYDESGTDSDDSFGGDNLPDKDVCEQNMAKLYACYFAYAKAIDNSLKGTCPTFTLQDGTSKTFANDQEFSDVIYNILNPPGILTPTPANSITVSEYFRTPWDVISSKLKAAGDAKGISPVSIGGSGVFAAFATQYRTTLGLDDSVGTPATACGDAGLRCCTVKDRADVDVPFLPSSDADEDGKWGCLINIFGWVKTLCASDLLQSMRTRIDTELGTKDLASDISVACNNDSLVPRKATTVTDADGKPQTEYTLAYPDEADCKCYKEADVVTKFTLSNQLCERYLGTDTVPTGATTEERTAAEAKFASCTNCFTNGGVWSGIGCVYVLDFRRFIMENIFKLAVGFAGLVALGCIIYAAFLMQTASNDPEKIKKSQDLITSCIMGLMLIIFSIFILRVIGVDILRLPGLAAPSPTPTVTISPTP